MTGERFSSGELPVHPKPIFILGILPRCGTNYLSDLLCRHPDCGSPAPIWEDFLVGHADLLARYVDTVHGRWDPRWGVEEGACDRLASHLGSGLVTFLAERTEATRVVTKTPRVDNLERFFTFLPDARLLILVRDGRAILESGVKTFGWYRDSALRKLAEAARTILDFDTANRDSPCRDKYRIVRYEDLWTNLENELHAILTFLDLDVSAYDFRAATQLPVRGSSTLPQRGSSAVHWEPVERTSEFDPMSRFRHWGRAKHERFNWVAGRYLEPFGYEETRFTSNRWLWSVWNVILDLRWLIVRTLGPIYLKWKRHRQSRRTPTPSAGRPGA